MFRLVYFDTLGKLCNQDFSTLEKAVEYQRYYGGKVYKII